MGNYLKQLKENKKGFTPVKMIVVIATIGILAAVLVPSMGGYLSTAKASRKEANAKTVYVAAQAAVILLKSNYNLESGEKEYKKGQKLDEKKADERLFIRIRDNLGESNFNKFEEIKVEVDNATVKSITILAVGDDKKDYTQYPK